ncbi:MAG: helix-turn-helix domain-containing protein [Melioribacteraceae bacterium]|nr:helix-turn-helix domain-containing protein [Melioribacteraceae bacterium]MDD3557583.1 helix-turn-helix domain-containing protein [Melioribacteraceae bacterium]
MMDNLSLQKFAQFLKQSREDHEVTLEQISKRTKIDIKYLKALEEGDFSVMPEVYVRAFIKSIAETIGLNPEHVLAKYETAKKGESKVAEDLNEKVEELQKPKTENKLEFVSTNLSDQKQSSPDNSIYIKYMYIAVPFLLIVLVTAYFLFFSSGEKVIVKETSFDEILSTERERYKLTTEDSSSVFYSGDSLNLVLTARDTVWIRALIDDVRQTEFLLRPTEMKRLIANSNYKLLIGNLPGIEFSLNNNNISLDSLSNVVGNVLIDREGIRLLKFSGRDEAN